MKDGPEKHAPPTQKRAPFFTLLRALRTPWLSARPAPARAALAGAGRVSVPIESKPRGGLVPFCAVTHGKVKALPPIRTTWSRGRGPLLPLTCRCRPHVVRREGARCPSDSFPWPCGAAQGASFVARWRVSKSTPCGGAGVRSHTAVSRRPCGAVPRPLLLGLLQRVPAAYPAGGPAAWRGCWEPRPRAAGWGRPRGRPWPASRLRNPARVRRATSLNAARRQ